MYFSGLHFTSYATVLFTLSGNKNLGVLQPYPRLAVKFHSAFAERLPPKAEKAKQYLSYGIDLEDFCVGLNHKEPIP